MPERFRVLFGDECAERDALLHDCAVLNRRVSATKPILSGRWGTGKTAILLLQNEALSANLKSVDASLERAWYLDESTLELQALISLRERVSTEGGALQDQAFVKSLESVWRAEILRVFRLVLGALWEKYGSPKGAHWDFARRYSPNAISGALWGHIPAVLGSIFGRQDAVPVISEVEESIRELFTEAARDKIVSCLKDVEKHELFPCVAIEPIETPASAIETGDHGLAQALITALLNVYNHDFAPHVGNPFNVRISIPWHRFDTRRLDFPQKLYEYRGNVEWTREDLRIFINRRIEWEFRRVSRPHGEDAWQELFPTSIPNGLCVPVVVEDSFRYFVRHTHHRARDLLRLVRTSIEAEADARGVQVDDVLRDRRSQVGVASIKDNFRKVGLDTTRELLNEGGRRYSELLELEVLLTGMSQPFELDDLKKRLQHARSSISVLRAAHILWEAGVIGVTATPRTADASQALTSAFTDAARISYRNKEATSFERWTWFEYNWYGELKDLLQKLSVIELSSCGLIFHPKTFEHFAPTTRDRTCPIGV